MEDYRTMNRANWDDRAAVHAAAPEYGIDRFRSDPDFLSGVVAFDRPLLGDLYDVRGVHLQCHLGTDTVSLSRLGANVTGLDFSPASLRQARELAASVGADVDFHEADVYDALAVLGRGRYQLVYTGIGALCWLPRMDRWADVVSGLLEPGGRLFLREGHPVLWAAGDPRPDGLLTLDFPYFERPEPMVWDEPQSYVPGSALAHSVTQQWNHGLGDIIGALLAAGMEVTGLVEHQSVPYEALPGQMTELDSGEWQLTDRPWRLPHSYTLQAVKSG